MSHYLLLDIYEIRGEVAQNLTIVSHYNTDEILVMKK